MILGVDLGNYATKTSKEIIFPSKCSRVGNILNNTSMTTDQGTFFVGDGPFDTEYRKLKKEFTKALFLYAVALSSPDLSNKVVVGLPLSQYKQDKEEMRNLLLESRVHIIGINGNSRKLVIEDVSVYPEGIGSIIGIEFEGVVIDIGGRTTDVCMVTDNNGIKKVNDPYSLPTGTLNLYNDFIKVLNSKYCLDLRPEDTDRILKRGLNIHGEAVDCGCAVEVFRQFVDSLVSTLQVEYSLKTQDIMLVGGGSQLLYKSLKNRIPGARMMDNPIFANAKGFKKVGDSIWQ